MTGTVVSQSGKAVTGASRSNVTPVAALAMKSIFSNCTRIFPGATRSSVFLTLPVSTAQRHHALKLDGRFANHLRVTGEKIEWK